MKYSALKGRSIIRAGLSAAAMLLLFSTALTAHADARTQAKRIHDRLTGVPPDKTTLDTLEGMVKSGDSIGAALESMKNPAFYNTTLKNWVTPWTNEDSSPYAELNDYTATVIGMIRDDVPFNTVLSDDIVYIGADGVVTALYSQVDNKHYAALESSRINLGDDTKLVRSAQSTQPNALLSTEQTAGVMTTRAFAAAFIREGTNRRAIRFTFKNFLCHDIEEVSDITRPTDRIRQDVSRNPGGDSTIFLNQCVGCHAGMDPLAQAFARLDYQALDAKKVQFQLVTSPSGRVQAKNHINSNNFPLGYFITDDRWDNYWRLGVNANLGWSTDSTNFPGYGNGPKSLGKELAASKAFALCQVQKAFKLTCLRDPANLEDKNKALEIANIFSQNNFSMKRVLAETAAYCKGQ